MIRDDTDDHDANDGNHHGESWLWQECIYDINCHNDKYDDEEEGGEDDAEDDADEDATAAVADDHDHDHDDHDHGDHDYDDHDHDEKAKINQIHKDLLDLQALRSCNHTTHSPRYSTRWPLAERFGKRTCEKTRGCTQGPLTVWLDGAPFEVYLCDGDTWWVFWYIQLNHWPLRDSNKVLVILNEYKETYSAYHCFMT